jgi:tRNA (guanine37-N1)-methyltransferase
MITFHILTLFPESFPSTLNIGLLGKAFQKNFFRTNIINIRDYSELSANSVDDKPFSGGAGMVLRPDIISKAIEKNFSSADILSFKKICFSAKGKSLKQKYIEESKDQKDFILLNGRYEGIDQRVIDYYDFEELIS